MDSCKRLSNYIDRIVPAGRYEAFIIGVTPTADRLGREEIHVRLHLRKAMGRSIQDVFGNRVLVIFKREKDWWHLRAFLQGIGCADALAPNGDVNADRLIGLLLRVDLDFGMTADSSEFTSVVANSELVR